MLYVTERKLLNNKAKEMTYYKLHNIMKKLGYSKGTYEMWESGLSIKELYSFRNNKTPYRSYAHIVVSDLSMLARKLKELGIHNSIHHRTSNLFWPSLTSIKIGLK